ncbi:MAG: EamA family transporter, partial [Burkholderiaceae bacterium]
MSENGTSETGGFRPSHSQAIALLIVCTLMWSIAGLVSRQLEQAKSLEVTFWRSLFCLIAMSVGIAWHWRA